MVVVMLVIILALLAEENVSEVFVSDVFEVVTLLPNTIHQQKRWSSAFQHSLLR